jgi:hypothetical protein
VAQVAQIEGDLVWARPAVRSGAIQSRAWRCVVITNEVRHRATKAYLDRFEQAAVNIEARPGKRTKLERLEFDAIRSQAADLRVELDDSA